MDGKEDDGKSPFMHSSCSRTAALKWTFQLLHFSGGSETNFPHPFMGHLLSCLEKEHSKGANFQSEGSRKLASKQPHERQTFPDHSMIKPISYLTVQTFAKQGRSKEKENKSLSAHPIVSKSVLKISILCSFDVSIYPSYSKSFVLCFSQKSVVLKRRLREYLDSKDSGLCWQFCRLLVGQVKIRLGLSNSLWSLRVCVLIPP